MPQKISMNDPGGSPVKFAAIDRGGSLMQPPDNRAASVNNDSQFAIDPNESVSFNDSGDPVSTVAAPAETTATPVETPTVTPTTTVPDKSTATVVKPTEKPVEKSDDSDTVVFDLPDSTVTPAKTPVIPTGPRNYDEYSEDIRPILRSLNNKQFATYAPILKGLAEKAKKVDELSQQQQQQPRFFHEHPEAYTIDPEYRQLTQDINYIQYESDHYTEQLINIKQGKPWTEIQGYDKKTGQPVFIEHKAPEDGRIDYRAEAYINNNLTKLNGIAQQKSQALSNFQSTYQQAVKSCESEMSEVDKRLFPHLPDPDKLPAEDKKMYDIAVGITPRAFKGHPMVPFLAKSFVMYVRLLKMYQASTQMITKLRAQLGDASAAEPNIVEGGGVEKPRKRGEIDEDEVVNFSDFNS